MNFEKLEKLIEKKGTLNISHDEGGSGMGYYWCANFGEWPFINGHTLEDALTLLISEHERLEKEALQKRINEIDSSAQL